MGRETDNDIVFNIGKVSRHHATLVASGRSYTIVDNDSANHVYVNDERVFRPRRLSSGDAISLSRRVVLLYVEEEAPDERLNQMVTRIWDSINKEDFLRLKEITGRVISLDSLEAILKIVLDEIVGLVGAERGFIALTNERQELLPNTAISLNIPFDKQDRAQLFSSSVVRQAILTRRKIFLKVTNDAQDISQSVIDLELRSVMCSPLIFGSKLLGVVYVDADRLLADFNPVDQLFFTLLSDHAAIAIENAEKYSISSSSLSKLKAVARESEERHKQLVQLSPDAILVVSSDRFVFANSASVRLFGANSEADLIGLKVEDLVPAEYRYLFQTEILPYQQNRQSNECRFRRLDGSDVVVSLHSTLFTYHGDPAVLLIARDISERKRLEENLLRAQKLESLGVLAGGIAHDFNNILSAILGNISLAQTFHPNGELLECLQDAERAASRARDLTQQLLTFSKGGAPIRKTSSISELIRDTSRFALRGSNVKCQFHFANNLWPVDVDVGQLSQVINNLIINADQAMKDGGSIEIRCSNLIVSSADQLTLKPGRYVLTEVSDSGVGIPQENQNKIFDPYFTTKAEGTGLGLATCYSIVSKHDGTITVSSELGVGSRFSVFLPASATDQFEERPPSGKLIPGHGKILVMDDEEIIRTLATRMLRRLGYEVTTAKDGEDAIRLYLVARDMGVPFDLVLMDLTIPGGMGGMETMRELSTLDPNVRALVTSGYSNNPVMANYAAYGFVGVITKPFRMEDLSATIATAMDRSS